MSDWYTCPECRSYVDSTARFHERWCSVLRDEHADQDRRMAVRASAAATAMVKRRG